MSPVLEVDDLRVTFGTGARRTAAVRGVSFSVAPGERLGIVGESGSGKSVTSQAVMRRLGMVHAPERDFQHPQLADDHPLKPHVVFVARPA